MLDSYNTVDENYIDIFMNKYRHWNNEQLKVDLPMKIVHHWKCTYGSQFNNGIFNQIQGETGHFKSKHFLTFFSSWSDMKNSVAVVFSLKQLFCFSNILPCMVALQKLANVSHKIGCLKYSMSAESTFKTKTMRMQSASDTTAISAQNSWFLPTRDGNDSKTQKYPLQNEETG